MLTIVHNMFETEKGVVLHTAKCGSVRAFGTGNVTSEVASILIGEGLDPASPVRIVQADPVLCGPPYEVSGLTLGLASILDVFCATGPESEETRHETSV